MDNHKRQDEEVLLTGMLAEFREALRDEIKKIEKSGQSSTLLRGGRRIESNGSDFWYRFQVDYLPSVPSDAPCNLIAGKNKYNVTVVSFDESEIILASSVELPDAIAQARLENGATVLMERLIKRIEDNAEKENAAGARMLPQYCEGGIEGFKTIEPDLIVTPVEQMNEGQNDAVNSSLRNDITYIWGPPGTGKTTVIGRIIQELYNQNRNVLVVSHTNTAVDGAIEKVASLRREDGSCPVLRIGISQKKLPEEVTLKSHIRVLGEELFARQEELTKLRDEKNKRVAQIATILSKFDWVNSQKIDVLAAAIQELEELEKKCDAAEKEYAKASEELKKLKAENPEIKKLSEYKESQKKLIEQIVSMRDEITALESKISQLTTDIQTAQDEIAKHTVYAGLRDKLSGMLSESFIEGKILEIESAIAVIRADEERLTDRKKLLEGIISQKGSFAALFSRKSIAQAETELPSIVEELKLIGPRISEQELTKKSYSEQLLAVRSLEKQIADVTPSKTKEYWEGVRSSSEENLTAAKRSKAEQEKQLSNNEAVLENIEQIIAKLQPLYKEMFRLISESGEKKKRFTEFTDASSAKRAYCEEIAEDELQNISAFLKIESTLLLHERLVILREKLAEIKAELEGENEEELRSEIGSLRIELGKINDELREISEKIKDLEKEAIQKAGIVGATLAKTYLSDTLQECQFDTIILDEASMASIPALWCASFLALRNIIIVGDFLQLPPIVMAETPMAKKWLGSDIFAMSGMQEKAKHKATKPDNFIMLNEQFRMEKDIADVANLYYGDYGGLKSNDHTSFRDKARDAFFAWYQRKDQKEKCIELIDTSNLHAWVTTIPQGKSHSRLNCFSAALDVEMAFQMLANDISKMQKTQSPASVPKVLIVAPYKPHIEKIKQLVKFEYKEHGIPEDANLIKAGTIHSFQGNEADVVIFDLVLDEPHWKANLFMTDAEMNADLRKLFNVAATRAKFKLFVVGNIKYLRSRAKNNALSELLDYLVDVKRYNIIDAKNAFPNLIYAKPRVASGDFGLNSRHIICREDSFFDYFLEDVKNFRKRMIIYSPFMTENRLAALLPILADAINSGKDVSVVTKALSDRGKTEIAQYKKIESELSSIGVSIIHKKGMHEKLVFVDDSVVWMGSLNALSFTGETGEVMHRHQDKEIAQEYQKIFDIPKINIVLQQKDELLCPICGEEMTLNEGDKGVYWRCIAGDYSRNLDQQYPHDGVLRCHCGGEYVFFMKNEPRWRCANDESHFIKMRVGDLKLPKMAEKIPTKKARHEVDQYFAQMMKEIEAKKAENTKKKPDQKKKSAKKSVKKVANLKKKDDGQLTLFDLGLEK